MSGWRDTDGKTAHERRVQGDAEARVRFLDTIRHRPLGLVKPALAAIFVAMLIAALLLRW